MSWRLCAQQSEVPMQQEGVAVQLLGVSCLSGTACRLGCSMSGGTVFSRTSACATTPDSLSPTCTTSTCGFSTACQPSAAGRADGVQPLSPTHSRLYAHGSWGASHPHAAANYNGTWASDRHRAVICWSNICPPPRHSHKAPRAGGGLPPLTSICLSESKIFLRCF